MRQTRMVGMARRTAIRLRTQKTDFRVFTQKTTESRTITVGSYSLLGNIGAPFGSFPWEWSHTRFTTNS